MLPLIPNPRALVLIWALLSIGLGALALSESGQTSDGLIWPELGTIPKKRAAVAARSIQHERPPRPRHLDVATPAQEAQAIQAEQVSAPDPAPRSKAPNPASMPPASVGTNGSFTPPPPSERKVMTPRIMANLESQEAEGRAILLNGIALAPPSAPEAIKAAISAANEIVGRPYIWGGGHASWYSTGYDCSGAVSYALGGGGLLPAPLDSTRLEGWGEPGPGRWLTVYASGSHAYAEIAGLRWDTVGDAKGTGPRWHLAPAYPEGFVERHPPGY
jgi:cell wall-associated NlpC family hydrolase